MHSLTEDELADPAFRAAYERGYEDSRADAERVRASEARLAARREPEPPRSRYYNTEAGELKDRLHQDDRADREAARHGEGLAVTEVPCCGRQVELPADADEYDPATAVCCHCAITYTVHLTEEDDGWGDEPLSIARFTVEHLSAAVARHRKGKSERHADERASVIRRLQIPATAPDTSPGPPGLW